MGETSSHLCTELTEVQREGLYTLFVGYRGMQQRTMSALIDCLLAKAAEGRERLLGAVLTKELRLVLDRDIGVVPQAEPEYTQLYGEKLNESVNTKTQPPTSIPVGGTRGSLGKPKM